MVDPDQPNTPHGKTLIAQYRAERLASRLANRISRQASRKILRAERLTRLGKPPPPDTQRAATDAQPSSGAGEAPPPSIFAQIVAQERRVHAATAQMADDAVLQGGNPESPAEPAEPLAATAEATEAAAAGEDAQTSALPLAPHPETAAQPAASGNQAAPPDMPPEAADVAIHNEAEGPDISATPAPPALEIVPPAAAPDPPPQSGPAPLTSLGFGPGMTTRLHHLGIFTVTDLATSEAAALKTLLGDVGDLVNVEYWIAQARSLLKQAA